ncbi:MAG: VRR-NUC domain-containing protein [Pseudobdellovibrionaceae bacterium]
MRLGPEDSLQRACVTWFKLQYPLSLIWATPNGGHRHPLEAAKFKMTGVLAGVPDLFIAEPKGKFHGMFVELKCTTKPTPAQMELIGKLHDRNYCTAICYSFDEFTMNVKKYFEPK